MRPNARKVFMIFAPGASLRQRVAYSLVIVRLILVPAILLGTYYLFEMGWIVDRIVSVDAPAATLAQQASIQMLEARRGERNFILARDASDAKATQNSVKAVTEIFAQIRDLQPEEQITIQNALNALNRYNTRFGAVVSHLSQPGENSSGRIETVVRNYEKDLNDLVGQSRRKSKAALIEGLRAQVDSFDSQVTSSLQANDPNLRRAAADLDTSSQEVFTLTSALEQRNWQRVQDDHREAKNLLHHAEWVLSVVSTLTILASVWVTLTLPLQVIKPLINLKDAVDHVVSGNYDVEFQLQGGGEIVELAKSVRSLITQLTTARQPA
jgi:nitrogen fixation/metabolism regulation signal transduction histidine kinase